MATEKVNDKVCVTVVQQLAAVILVVLLIFVHYLDKES